MDKPEQPDIKGPDHCLLFVHIPKTGGTTFGQILEQAYPDKKFVWIYKGQVFEVFDRLSEQEKKSLDVLAGHIPYGFHQKLPHPKHSYVTFLRDPVERCLSHYFYILRSPENYLYEPVVRGGMSFEDFVCSNVSMEMDNFQCRLVSGIYDQVPFGGFDEKCLRLAKKRLRDDFEVFGLTERFDESVFLMRERFGWKITDYGKENVGINKPELKLKSQERVQLIQKENAADTVLYRYAQELFDQRYRRGWLKTRYFLFRKVQTVRKKFPGMRKSIKSILRRVKRKFLGAV